MFMREMGKYNASIEIGEVIMTRLTFNIEEEDLFTHMIYAEVNELWSKEGPGVALKLLMDHVGESEVMSLNLLLLQLDLAIATKLYDLSNTTITIIEKQFDVQIDLSDRKEKIKNMR